MTTSRYVYSINSFAVQYPYLQASFLNHTPIQCRDLPLLHLFLHFISTGNELDQAGLVGAQEGTALNSFKGT